jgi:hypothetical protein
MADKGFTFDDNTSDVIASSNTGGRPKKPEKEKKTKRINLYLTEEEYKTLIEQAGGVPASSFVRSIVLSRLQNP